MFLRSGERLLEKEVVVQKEDCDSLSRLPLLLVMRAHPFERPSFVLSSFYGVWQEGERG